MGFFDELRNVAHKTDPIGSRVLDRALHNDALTVKAGSQGIRWLGNALGWDGLEQFGHHWAAMATADTNDTSRLMHNAALTAAAIFGGMEAAGAGGAAGAEAGATVSASDAATAGSVASASDTGAMAGVAGSTPAAGAGAGTAATTGATSGLGQYATVANAQKLYAGLQLANALSAPKMPDATPPPKPMQTPGLQNARGNLTGTGGTAGVASTFLTGTAGVDPSLLNLGRSTLLGG